MERCCVLCFLLITALGVYTSLRFNRLFSVSLHILPFLLPGTLVPGNVSSGRPSVLVMIFFLISQWTSELPRPIVAKFYHVITICSDWIILVQKFRGPPLKNLGAKHSKFGPILHNCRLWSRISPERDKISKIGKICDLAIPPAFSQTSPVNFGPLSIK